MSILERQYTGGSHSTLPTMSSPESVAASLISSATSFESTPFSNLRLDDVDEQRVEQRVELEGSSPAAELEGHVYSTNSFSTTKEVRMKL
jgi:hypothetical protein